MKKTIYVILTYLVGSLPLHSNGQMMAATIDRDVYNYWETSFIEINKETNINMNADDGIRRPNFNRGKLMGATIQLVHDLKRTNLWDSITSIFPIITDTPFVTYSYRSTNQSNLSTRTRRASVSIKQSSPAMLFPTADWFRTIPDIRNEGIDFRTSGLNSSSNNRLRTGFLLSSVPNNQGFSMTVYTTGGFINGTGTNTLMGASSGTNIENARINLNQNSFSSTINTGNEILTSRVYTSPYRMFTSVRYSNNLLVTYENGNVLTTNPGSTTTAFTSGQEIWLGALNNNGAIGSLSKMIIGYADIGIGISAVGVARKYEIVNRYFQNINRPTF